MQERSVGLLGLDDGEPLKLVWKHPPKRKTPKASEAPAINATGRESFLPPDAPRKRVQRCGQDSCSSPQEQQRAIPYDQEENRELGLLDRDLETLVLERIPLASRMTARAVSRAWNSKLSTRPQATLVVLNARNSRQLIAFDTRHGVWAALPDARSLPVGASRLLGAAGDVALAKSECPGRLLVGSPLGGVWADVVLPPMWHSDLPGAPMHFLARRPHDTFKVISIYGHQGNVIVYDSSKPGHWSTIYYEDTSHIVCYSLLDQSTQYTVLRWPLDCMADSGDGKMVYCGGHLFVIDVRTDWFGRIIEPSPLHTIVVWRFLGESGGWVVEFKCPVGARRTSNGYCFDGVDVLWVVIVDEEGSVENLVSYSLSSKQWRVHCSSGPFKVETSSCVFIDTR
ncbi:hypothetical protein SELMODRAFT_431682 [Selaginella moellendorffii]|uniref:F-box domain-containing protein n=1 Tax=Selaginella moellendorffii TaxID=88036 RepID=D8TDF7_SELML|nr:hypothetical protein SELMODRAFT_431682 [Selaginella moellendorffii]